MARSMPTWRAPSGSKQTDRQAPTRQTRNLMQKACRRSSWLRVLRCQGAAKHKPLGDQAAKLCYRFDPLTPSARSANLIAGDRTKNGFPALNKELTTTQKRPDRKSPIHIRIRLPPAVSHERTANCASSRRPRRPPDGSSSSPPPKANSSRYRPVARIGAKFGIFSRDIFRKARIGL